MPAPGLSHVNGRTANGALFDPDERAHGIMLARIEAALREMTGALMLSGFSEYEAGEVSLATRTAITAKVKERFGRR